MQLDLVKLSPLRSRKDGWGSWSMVWSQSVCHSWRRATRDQEELWRTEELWAQGPFKKLGNRQEKVSGKVIKPCPG